MQRALQNFSMSYNKHGDGQIHLLARRLPRSFVDAFYQYRDSLAHAAEPPADAGATSEDVAVPDDVAHARSLAYAPDHALTGAMRVTRRRTAEHYGRDGDAPAGGAADPSAHGDTPHRAPTRAASPYNLRPFVLPASPPGASPGARSVLYS